MRGKVPQQLGNTMHYRITPAYAGKSTGYSKKRKDNWDHPRLCGEKPQLAFIFHMLEGSPPPMRGKDRYRSLNNKITRITPAYAGKSIADYQRYYYVEDHPRLCGEKITM